MEASVVTKRGHERRCPYVQLMQYWDNEADSDGEWPVTEVLAMRGPPNRRFVQLQWAEPAEDVDVDTTDWEYGDVIANGSVG